MEAGGKDMEERREGTALEGVIGGGRGLEEGRGGRRGSESKEGSRREGVE